MPEADGRLLTVNEEQLHREQEGLSEISLYFGRYVTKIFDVLTRNRFVLALISPAGTILDLYPEAKAVTGPLFGGRIRKGVSFAQSGHNAITDGLLRKKSCVSVGEENGLSELRDLAVYFSAMNMREIYEPYEPKPACGIALIVHADEAHEEFFAMVEGIAHDIMLNVQFKNISTMYYERSGKGLLVVDTMLKKGQTIVTYVNDEFFEMMGTKPRKLIGHKAEELVLPPPANPRFWEIVAKNKKIREEYITLSLKNREVNCIVSTDAYLQPAIKSAGVVFYFTNDRKKNEEVSAMVANGAVKTFRDVIGEDPKLKEVIERAKRMAGTDSNIMILGESGTGKDVFAQAIHNASSRRNKPFVALNCGAIPKDLIESELFGYEAGSFTGARKNGNMGKFELATGGTIFLDEIGEMPLDLQAKLLRVVEQKKVVRLGGSRLIDVDVKIIAATNVNILEMIKTKRFRADLYYRLSTMRLNLMPIRERRGDIVPLAKYFIRKTSERIGREDIMQITPEARELLTGMDWPGNVREIQNLIECIVQLYPDERITPRLIRENAVFYEEWEEKPARQEKSTAGLKKITKEELLEAMEICGNNRSNAAKYLGLSRRTFYRRMKEFGL